MALNYRVGDEPVPGYRLERFLGRGAIGEVWQVTGPGGTEAALKIIDLAGGGVHGQKEFRALQIVKRIHHPNLTPIMGAWAKSEDGLLLDDTDSVQVGVPCPTGGRGTVRDTMIVAAEAVNRGPTELIIAMGLGQMSLSDRLRDCRDQGLDGVPVGELLEYLDAAAKAIDFLNSPVHELATGTGAIVHCDVKPLNILIVGGAAQVCDFGLAHMVGNARSTALTMGTVAYIAPEMLQGEQPTPATDQYSLAISYFELRTGELPYREETIGAVMRAVLEGDLELSRLPKAEQAVIRKATARDPGHRYPSAMEMVRALQGAVEERSVAREPLVLQVLSWWSRVFHSLWVALSGLWSLLRPTAGNGREKPVPQTSRSVREDGDTGGRVRGTIIGIAEAADVGVVQHPSLPDPHFIQNTIPLHPPPDIPATEKRERLPQRDPRPDSSAAAEPSVQKFTPHGSSSPPRSQERRKEARDSAVSPVVGGAFLGKYEIVRQIGRGRTGIVYLGRLTGRARPVALKVLPGAAFSRWESVQRLLREAKVAATLQHPNLCSFLDIGQDAGELFLVMDYLEGKTLAQRLEGGLPLPVAEMADLAYQLIQVLKYLAERGITHRNVTPRNLMISNEGLLTLMDLGLAKTFEDFTLDLTITGAMLGTPTYMAPEQILDTKRASQQTDLYAAGVTIFQMATGRLPFPSDSLGQLLTEILEAPPPDPCRFRADLPDSLARLIAALLDKKPTLVSATLGAGTCWLSSQRSMARFAWVTTTSTTVRTATEPSALTGHATA